MYYFYSTFMIMLACIFKIENESRRFFNDKSNFPLKFMLD